MDSSFALSGTMTFDKISHSNDNDDNIDVNVPQNRVGDVVSNTGGTGTDTDVATTNDVATTKSSNGVGTGVVDDVVTAATTDDTTTAAISPCQADNGVMDSSFALPGTMTLYKISHSTHNDSNIDINVPQNAKLTVDTGGTTNDSSGMSSNGEEVAN